MSEPPVPKVTASGERSIAAAQIGEAVTGDYAQIDARTINLGSIPAPASVAAPPGTHNLPRPPVRVFVGRETALGQLGRALDSKTTAVVTQAIYGLGGVGKSELALQHAQTRGGSYTLTWWITAEDPAQIETGLAELAGRLCREIKLAGSTTDAADWAVAWLQSHQRWLLILDNVNDPADVDSLLGQLTGGHILITTRRDTGWDQVADPIRLDILDPCPAAELLTARTNQHHDQDSADLIAEELGFLPLALNHAAAYATASRISLAAYLKLLHEHPADMYSTGGRSAQQTVALTWDITLEAISVRDPAAVSLLHILACYAPDDIPRIIVGGPADPDRILTNKDLALLASYSMITLTTNSVSMHRLVQAILRAREPSSTESVYGGQSPLATALTWLNASIPVEPEENVAEWPLLRQLVPHADHLAAQFQAGTGPLELIWVENRLGVYLSSQGQHAQALRMRESALQLAQVMHGNDHPSTAATMANLAATYRDLGRPADALPLEQRALAIIQAVLGPEHPDTALRLSNLAATYHELGRLADAQFVAEQALAIIRAWLSPMDPGGHVRMADLAWHLGVRLDAQLVAEQALAIIRPVLGPTTATLTGRWPALPPSTAHWEDPPTPCL